MKYEPVNPHIVLDRGEKICTECNGWGYLKSERHPTGDKMWATGQMMCPKCLGKCTLEFIDAVIGHNRDPRWG